MTPSNHPTTRRPSHALPSQAIHATVSTTSTSPKSPQRLPTSRQVYAKDVLGNLAQHAYQRHERSEGMLFNSQSSLESTSSSSSTSASPLPDLEDNQSLSNSALFRRYMPDLSPTINAGFPKSARRSLRSYEEESYLQLEAIDREEDIEQAEDPDTNASSQTRGGPNDDGEPLIRQNLWETIGALSLNQKRLIMANNLQETLCNAVSMYYSGIGVKALVDLDEAQKKARRMDFRIINGQAQLWRAIILDEINQTELIAELLADALFLLAAGPGAALPFAEIPPEDADFYQLWRMVYVRNYWYLLWRYLKMEDTKDTPDIPVQDLDSQGSKDEARKWALHFLDRLKNCFDHSKWSGFDQGKMTLRSPRINDALSNEVRGGPLAQRIQVLTQKLYDLETRDRENTTTIEKLRMDILRYKAEREVFNTNLSTSHTDDGTYPHHISDESLKDGLHLTPDVPLAIDKDSPSGQDPIHGTILIEPGFRAALGLDQAEFLYQQLKNEENGYPVQNRQPQLTIQESQPARRSLPQNANENMRYRQLSESNKRINLWTQQAHGGRVQSGLSQIGSPFSPNNITPSSPSSARSWRKDRSLSSRSHRLSGYSQHARLRNDHKLLQQVGMTPSRAWKANNVLPSPISQSTRSAASRSSNVGDKDKSPPGVEHSFKTLHEELGDALSLDSEADTRVIDRIWYGTTSSEVKDLFTSDRHQDDDNYSKQTFRVPNYDTSRPQSPTTDNSKSNTRRMSISPESISPLANSEDLPFTDTPGDRQLEEALCHIRAHRKQRQRSMSETSLIPEGLNQRTRTKGNDSNGISCQRETQNTEERKSGATSGVESLAPFSTDFQILSLEGNSNKDINSFNTAPNTSQEKESQESMKFGLDKMKDASSPNVQRSRSAEYNDQQVQPSRRVSVASGTALKLQTPPLVSTSEYHRRASVVPASPSPLRTSFSQAAASEDPYFPESAESSG